MSVIGPISVVVSADSAHLQDEIRKNENTQSVRPIKYKYSCSVFRSTKPENQEG